ncbi:MAG: rRNA cytosine-C5-methyltransferase [Marmoricola sp.]|jgi:16S rRNA (cytosine967-C5)-methyltransferase|nr:rRNA cytosine-C5-methyltransferase [Marmoricola sp.]
MTDNRNKRASGGQPPRARVALDPARIAAYDVLTAVRAKDSYANLVLPGLLRERNITGRDAAFATELTSGTLRRQGTYDAIIAVAAGRPLAKIDAAVLDALRLGAHQVLSTRVAPHAAVTSTVDLVRAKVGHGPAGFSNAVMRRISEQDLAGWVRRVAPDPVTDPVGFASIAQAHPRWIVSALTEALGSTGELDALLAADNEPPKVTLVARPGLCAVESLEGTPLPISPYAVELAGGDPGAIKAVRDGRAGVQDAGSQLVAIALARAPVAGRDDRWLDLCAGPGGKAALLAALAAESGARVLAAELQPHRAALVQSGVRAAVAGIAGVIVADGTRPAWPAGSFDRVLVDAPCSGLGALRRRPESRWRRVPADIESLLPLQRALLDAALDSVRVGGVVGYATCSPVVSETAGVVGGVLAGRSDVRLEAAEPLLPWVTNAASAALPGAVQLWPHRHGTDAMFFALLRKI